MTLSIHIVVDNAPYDVLERALLYCKRVKQLKYVNIAAGAQLDRGMQYAERMHIEVPKLRIIWRNLAPEDTGILATMDADKLYNDKVRPYREWFQRNQIIFMPDNETSGDDNRIRSYADEEAKVLHLLHGDGLNGAVCRFGTGQINDGTEYPEQYHLLKPIFDAMNGGDVASPNEYSNRPGKPSGGHLYRYDLLRKAARRKLPIVIGEAGISVEYDPGDGYQSIGMTDEAFVQQMLDEEIWYEDGAIDRSLYLMGGYTHESFRLRFGILKLLEDHYAALPVVVQPPVVTEPPPEEEIPEPMPETLPEPPIQTPQPPVTEGNPVGAEPTWMKDLNKGERARIAMGRLMLEFGEEMLSLIVDDEAFLLIGKMAVMLDAKG